MIRKARKVATAAADRFRIGKNYQNKKKREKEWHALNATHRADLMLQYAQQKDHGGNSEDALESTQADDEDWMAVDPIGPANKLLFSPSIETVKVNTSFSVDIENAQPAAKFERKPKPRVTHEVDGFAVVEQGQASGQFELPSHVDPNRELQYDTPRGEIKKVLGECSSPLPLLSGARSTNAYSDAVYGNNSEHTFTGQPTQSPTAPVNFLFQGIQAATNMTSARPPSLYSMKRASSQAMTKFANAAATATDIALQAAGIRDEDAYSDSDDDFFLDENGMPFTGVAAPNNSTVVRGKSSLSGPQTKLPNKKRDKFKLR